ncbi:MAG: metallophosphoesterase [Gemmatimonas sp.]
MPISDLDNDSERPPPLGATIPWAKLRAIAIPSPKRRRAKRPLPQLFFGVTYFSLYLLLCWSVITAITWRLFPGSTTLVGVAALYSAAPIFLFIRRLRWNFYPTALFRVLVVRVLLYMQLMLPLVTAAGILGSLIGWPFGASLATARALALLMFVSALVLFTVGYLGSRSLVTRDVEARIPNLPQEFDGLRIVQLSDLHVGPQRSRTFLARVVRNVTALRADVIAVTGDLIDDRPEDVEVYAAALAELNAPFGVFMIPGNHDVYAGWNDVHALLRRLVPGHVLVNESRVIQKGAASLAIVGTGDPAGTQRGIGAQVGPDIPRALASVPANTVAIALAHNPALFPVLAERGVSLTLSGHTHWGQFAIPKRQWSLASRFLQYAMGTYQVGDSLLYVSPGTGYWGIPFRIGALPEITAVTLRRAPAAGISMGEAQRAV